jgi:hypothetical protein
LELNGATAIAVVDLAVVVINREAFITDNPNLQRTIVQLEQ